MSLLTGDVLLTGATGGIGQAIARALAARGGRLILTGRRADVLEPLAAGLGARAVACDLADRDEVARLIDDLTQEQVDRMLEVNLRAPIALARALVPGMTERRRGHMVFVSSLSAKSVGPASSIYSATKFGLRGFALALREDLRSAGVGVSTVLPGFIREAGMFADSGAELPFSVGTRSPEDVARAVIAAIERNRAEVAVAPLWMRLGANAAVTAPALASAVSRRLGSERLAGDIASGQLDKR